MLAVLALTVPLAGCGGSLPPTKPGVVRVVAAENFWGDIAKQIGGRHVEVTSLISNPNADPHLFESNPQAVAEVAGAQLVIANGDGYDEFLSKMLSAGGRHGRLVLTMADQVPGTAGANPNPHLWYWTSRLPHFATAIAGYLSRLDSPDRAYFDARARRFVRSLQPLLETIATIKRKYAGTPIAYTERVPGYLVAAAGLVVAMPVSFAQAIEDGNDPSPGDVATFDADITDHRIKVLLYNAQVVDAATTRLEQLAVDAHIPVVGVTETMPAGTTFQAWQLSQDRDLLRALGG